MNGFADRHLLVATAVVTPAAILCLSLDARTEDVRESEYGIAPRVFDVNVRVNQLIGERVTGSHDLILAVHAPNGLRCDSSETLVKIFRAWLDHAEIMGYLGQEETIDRLNGG